MTPSSSRFLARASSPGTKMAGNEFPAVANFDFRWLRDVECGKKRVDVSRVVVQLRDESLAARLRIAQGTL